MGTRSGDLDPVDPGLPGPGRLVRRGPRFHAQPPVRAQGPGRATTTCAPWSRPPRPATPEPPWRSPWPPTGSRSTSAATTWPSAARRPSSSPPGSARTRTSSAASWRNGWARSGCELDAGLNRERSKEPRVISTPESATPGAGGAHRRGTRDRGGDGRRRRPLLCRARGQLARSSCRIDAVLNGSKRHLRSQWDG